MVSSPTSSIALALTPSAVNGIRFVTVNHSRLRMLRKPQESTRVSTLEGKENLPSKLLPFTPYTQSPPLTSNQAMFDILEADIVVIQETKIQQKDLRDDMVLVPGWDVFFSLPKHKKGKMLPLPKGTS